MTVRELTKDQMEELKQSILCERLDKDEGRCPYMSELADANLLVSDDEAYEKYGGVEFSMDDFACTAGKE